MLSNLNAVRIIFMKLYSSVAVEEVVTMCIQNMAAVMFILPITNPPPNPSKKKNPGFGFLSKFAY